MEANQVVRAGLVGRVAQAHAHLAARLVHRELQALDLQVQLTQAELASALALPAPEGHPSLNRVRLEQQGSTEVEGQKAWRLQGRFDWQLPGDPLKVDSGFEVLLLRGDQGQSWRLVRPPTAAAPQWRSYPLVAGA